MRHAYRTIRAALPDVFDVRPLVETDFWAFISDRNLIFGAVDLPDPIKGSYNPHCEGMPEAAGIICVSSRLVGLALIEAMAHEMIHAVLHSPYPAWNWPGGAHDLRDKQETEARALALVAVIPQCSLAAYPGEAYPWDLLRRRLLVWEEWRM